MKKGIAGLMILGVSLVAGTVAGYLVATDDELRNKLIRGAKSTISSSKKKFDEMSEDVALRTAQLTRNPQINQDWVANQWDALGM